MLTLSKKTIPWALFGGILIIFAFLKPTWAADLESQAAAKKAPPFKSKLREDEPTTESFSAKVKVIRDIQDDTEVFFESEKARGAYLLPATLKDFNLFKNRLQKSLAVGGPIVNVTTDNEKRIQNVEIDESKTPAPAATSWEKI